MSAKLAIGILLLISILTAYMPYYLQPAEASVSIKNLSNSAGFSSDPQIAVSGNNVYVIWSEFTTERSRQVLMADSTPGNWEIFFRTSNDNGATFGDVINLSNNAGESGRHRIAVSDNNIYVIWADSTPGNWEIFFRVSNDNGATFGDVINLSNNAGESGRHRIAVSDNNVYVVWRHSDDIFFRTSNDNGATFGDVINLSNNAVSISENTPDQSNGGNATNTKRSDLPQIAASSNNVYVVWADYVPGDYDIQFRASNDNGATFGSAVNIETSGGLADLPQIAVSDNHVYVVWGDYSLAEGLVIFFRASNDNGATFGSAMDLIRNVGYSDSTPMVVSGNNVYIVSAVGNIDVFFRTSNDNGAIFSDAVNLSENIEASSDPHMAVSGGNVYIVWEDYSTGIPDIFFTTFIPGTDMRSEEKIALLTDNGSMKVEVTMDRETVETEQPVRFTLRFLNPLTEQQLQHVNYSFMITDENGNNVVSESNIHAHAGTDTRSITFSETGSFTLSIDVTGIGINEPYDSSYSGMASTALIVVPEFPLGILAVMGLILGAVIVITRSRNQLLR
jgi:hypothetical protein